MTSSRSSLTCLAILLMIIQITTVLVSGQRVAGCQQCQRQPDLCRRIAGLYTVAVLNKGSYNKVVTVPPRACSISITELALSDNYLAVKTDRGDNIVNGYWSVGSESEVRGAGTTFYRREGGTCPGQCITSPGPTDRTLHIQLLYFDKNPGVAYSFVLPNDVPFQPFEVNRPRSSHPATTPLRHRPAPSQHSDRRKTAAFTADSEKYDSQGRQRDVTSQAQEPYGQRRLTANPAAGNYGTQSYGSHTLGGRGQSYSYSYTDNTNNNVISNRRDTVSNRNNVINNRKDFINNRNDVISNRKDVISSRKDVITNRKDVVSNRNVISSSNSQARVAGSARRGDGQYGRQRGSVLRSHYDASRARSGATYNSRRLISNRRPSRPILSRRPTEHRSASPSWRQRQSPNIISAYDTSRTREYQALATARGGLVDRTFSRGLEAEGRLQTIDGQRGTLQRGTSQTGTAHRQRGTAQGGIVPRVAGQRVPSYRSTGHRLTGQSVTSHGSIAQSFTGHRGTGQRVTRPGERRLTVATGAGGEDYEWTISGLSDCSLTCGGGIQETQAVCVLTSSGTQVVVTPDNCHNALKPPLQRVPCNTQPCQPAWESEEWSECSVTCGGGTQERRVECKQRFSESVQLSVSASQCRQTDKPAVAQQCNNQPCASWTHGEWGKCSLECGGGERHREVDCMDGQGVQIPASFCPADKPASTERCNSQPCDTQWWVSHWATQCSAECGSGVVSRHVMCGDRAGRSETEESCDLEARPRDRKQCEGTVGCGAIWFAGPWSQCSESCGQGLKTRRVLCMLKKEGGGEWSMTHPAQCDTEKKPTTEELCVNTDCPAQYYMTSWSQCSVTCGQGVRSRNVRCLDEQRQPSWSCDQSHLPRDTEACQLPPCVDRHEGNRHLSRSQPGGRQQSGTARSSVYIEPRDDDDDDDDERLDDNVDNSNSIADTDRGHHGLAMKDSEMSGEKQAPTSTHPIITDAKCKNTFWNCRLVVQARLCAHAYYQTVCCVACIVAH